MTILRNEPTKRLSGENFYRVRPGAGTSARQITVRLSREQISQLVGEVATIRIIHVPSGNGVIAKIVGGEWPRQAVPECVLSMRIIDANGEFFDISGEDVDVTITAHQPVRCAVRIESQDVKRPARLRGR